MIAQKSLLGKKYCERCCYLNVKLATLLEIHQIFTKLIMSVCAIWHS